VFSSVNKKMAPIEDNWRHLASVTSTGFKPLLFTGDLKLLP